MIYSQMSICAAGFYTSLKKVNFIFLFENMWDIDLYTLTYSKGTSWFHMTYVLDILRRYFFIELIWQNSNYDNVIALYYFILNYI